ncbi:MAG: hypothetical protein Q8L35_08370 [Actinomycetota bacterium]|nr:hypothetical protein [Actinomycetota bacterium]
MKPKLLFALKVTAFSGLLFLVWPAISTVWRTGEFFSAALLIRLLGLASVRAIAEKNYLLIPTISVIAASSNSKITRKVRFALLAFACQFGFSVLSLALGMRELIEDAGGISAPGSLIMMARFYFPWMLTIFIILLFVQGKPEALWEIQAPLAKAKKQKPTSPRYARSR